MSTDPVDAMSPGTKQLYSKLRMLLSKRGVPQEALNALHSIEDLKRLGSRTQLLVPSELALKPSPTRNTKSLAGTVKANAAAPAHERKSGWFKASRAQRKWQKGFRKAVHEAPLGMASRAKSQQDVNEALAMLSDSSTMFQTLASLTEGQLHSSMRHDPARQQCERCLQDVQLERLPPSMVRDLLPSLSRAPHIATSTGLRAAVNRVPPDQLFPLVSKLDVLAVSRLFGPTEWGVLGMKLRSLSVTEQVMALLWLPEWRNMLVANINPFTVLMEAEEVWAVRYLHELMAPSHMDESLIWSLLSGADPPVGGPARPIVAEACWQYCLGDERFAAYLADWLNAADADVALALMKQMSPEDRERFTDVLLSGPTTQELLAEMYARNPSIVSVVAPADQVFHCTFKRSEEEAYSGP